MDLDRRLIASGATAIALGAVASGTALARSNTDAEHRPAAAGTETENVHEDDAGERDQQVTDATARELAAASAFEAAGGQGTVTEVELADEGDSGYEVEVRKDDGSFVEVALTDAFEVVSVEVADD